MSATRIGSHDYQRQVGFFSFAQSIAANPEAEAEQTKLYLNRNGVRVDAEYLESNIVLSITKLRRLPAFASLFPSPVESCSQSARLLHLASDQLSKQRDIYYRHSGTLGRMRCSE